MAARAWWVAAALALVAAAGCSSFKDDASSAADAGEDARGDDAALEGAAGDDAGGGGHDAAGDGATGSDSASDAPGGGDDGGEAGGSPCDGSSCPIETVVSGLNQATLVRVDANNVYFGDEGTATGVVYQCAKTGCASPVVLGPGYATGMGVDAAHVYWNDFSGGQVVSCAIGGCSNMPTVIAPTQPQAEGVSFDGTNLYWATGGNVVTCVPPACATRTTLATGQGTIVQTAAETGAVYWVSAMALFTCDAAGCASPRKVSPSAGGAGPFVLNGVAYFTSGNAVVSCPVGGCTTPHTIGASDDPYGIGTDGVDVYWLDDIDQVVYRCPVSGCGGGPTHFADGQLSQPGANVALDGEYAYWTVPDRVVRKHK